METAGGLRTRDRKALENYQTELDNNWHHPASGQDGSQRLYGLVKRLVTHQAWRREDMRINALLYGGWKPELAVGLGLRGFLPTTSASNPGSRMTLNIVRPVVDTAITKVCKGDVKITFLTANGDWGLQQRAKKVDKFVEGQFAHNNVRELALEIARDAAIFDAGSTYVGVRAGELKIERVLPGELIVDDQDGRYRRPRQIFRRRWIPKDQLSEDFPKFAEAIAKMKPDHWDDDHSVDNPRVANDVVVVDGWYLPSSPEAGDGVHVTAIDGTELLREEWSIPRFPFSTYRWSNRLIGFWGEGLLDGLRNIQREINKTLRTIEESYWLGCVPRVFLKIGSGVVKKNINNDIMSIVNYTGDAPIFHEGAGINPQLVQHLENYVNRAYESVGVNRMEAQSEKPKGLESAPSIRTARDIGTERLMVATKLWEGWHVDLGDLIVQITQQHHARGTKIQIKAPGRMGYDAITSKDVAELERQDCVIRAFPTNMLPSTPEGKLAMLKDMVGAGIISQMQAKRLLDYPDIESVTSLENAPLESVLAEADWIIQGKEYRAPEPFMPLELGIQIMQWTYLKVRQQNAPQSVLDDLQQWMGDAKAMLDKAAAQNAPPPPPPTPPLPPNGIGPPQASPAPAPVSNLIPNAGVVQ